MSEAMAISIALTVITAATPLLYAALGELVVERAGVLNLGLEGMMLVGAVAAFAVVTAGAGATVGVCAAAVAGVTVSMLFAVVVLEFKANQVASGLALTLFGVGVSSLLGRVMSACRTRACRGSPSRV